MSVEAFLIDLVTNRLLLIPPATRCDVSSIIGLVSSGEPTDIARDKDKMIGEAVWQEYLEETKQK